MTKMRAFDAVATTSVATIWFSGLSGAGGRLIDDTEAFPGHK
ncbi:MAG: hypothetical protein ACYCP0_00040 [Acidiferrobacteraceae bacterium]